MKVWWAMTTPPYTHRDMVGHNLVWGSSENWFFEKSLSPYKIEKIVVNLKYSTTTT